MQKATRIVGFENQKQFETIFLSWSDLKLVNTSGEKKLLRHYLCSVEHLTRGGFFNFYPQEIPLTTFGINKNAFKKLNELHLELGTLKISKGRHGKNLYSFSDKYPKSMAEWLRCGGYTKINREELKLLLNDLNDNELRLYFHLKRIFEYHGSPGLGVETWPKVLRDALGLSQPTFKKIIQALVGKGFICSADPISEHSRQNNRFVFVIKKICSISESKEFSPSIQEILPQEAQNPQNFAHLKEIRIKKEIKLKQGDDVEKKKTSIELKSDFNFYGLDRLARPMCIKTVRLLMKQGLSWDLIQESVMRFARYYKSHPAPLLNPVGYLVATLQKEKVVFIEPEWFLVDHYHGDFKEKQGFRNSLIAPQEKKTFNAEEVSYYLQDIMTYLCEDERAS